MDATMTAFGSTHFGAARLGDKRRTDRLVRVADRIANHPGGSLPEKVNRRAELDGLYHLMNGRTVTHAAVVAPHLRRTRQAILDHDGTVLIGHDDTDLDLSARATLAGDLGPIGGKRQRGDICHNSLAVTTTGQPLGLIHQILHVNKSRPKKGLPRAALRDCPHRQTRLWVDGRRAIGDFPAGKRVVDLVDRGGDTFEFLDFEDAHGYDYVARARSNRTGLRGHQDGDEEGRKIQLSKHLRSLPEQGRRGLAVSYKPAKPTQPARPGRTTAVAVSWAAVTLPAPTRSRARGQHRQVALRVWVVRVWEPAPPAGATALGWLLITNVPVRTLSDAWERVDWYEWRWPVMEEYHKGQKTGCAIEGPQFRTTAAMAPMIGLLSVVAWLLMYLRWAGRNPATAAEPASDHVPESGIAWLSRWRCEVEQPAWTVREFFYALAYLGGHQNRKSDGAPGWQTLWKGWMKLRTVLEFTAEVPP